MQTLLAVLDTQAVGVAVARSVFSVKALSTPPEAAPGRNQSRNAEDESADTQADDHKIPQGTAASMPIEDMAAVKGTSCF